MRRLKKLAILAAVAATALLVATVAFGATPGDDGNAKLCSVKYGPHKGEVRLMDSSATACHPSEQSVTLATAASIPTPQPAPKTTTEFAVITGGSGGGGAPAVGASSGGVSIASVYGNRVTVNFGHSLAQCALAAPAGDADRPNPVALINQSGDIEIRDQYDRTSLVVTCNA